MQGRPSRAMGSAWTLMAKFHSALTWLPGVGAWKLPSCPSSHLVGLTVCFHIRAVLLCQHPSQVSYLPCSFRGPPSCHGRGPAPLVGAQGTPSDHLHSVMSQSLVTSPAPPRPRAWQVWGRWPPSLGVAPRKPPGSTADGDPIAGATLEAPGLR